MGDNLEYDRNAEFELGVETVAERPGVTIAECRFDNVEGDPVRGYLVRPTRKASAGVVFQHTTSGREAFLPEAIQLAEAGASSICLPFVALGDPRAMIRQSIFAIRRGTDILRREVERVALVGHSGASMAAATVSGLDHRYVCFVFEVGLSGMSFHYRDSQHPSIRAIRESTPPEVFQAGLDALKPYDSVRFVGQARGPKLFQFARFDIGVTEAESQAFYAAASEPKQQRWYDTGHVVNDPAAFADRARFLAEHLDLPDLPKILLNRVS
ncbi:alpha/beta hydrolase family protein [Kutzneria sp. NPDC052558]|uniref:alpha/beta hydrolase family protein n=1 Tax=Kutzneria sp. NPDC052558 TaxID=3364121 RepID=UPI0037CCA3D3